MTIISCIVFIIGVLYNVTEEVDVSTLISNGETVSWCIFGACPDRLVDTDIFVDICNVCIEFELH